MTPQEFLEQVVPAGLIVIAKLNGRGFKHYVCENFDQAAKTAASIDDGKEECYFGLGALHEKRVRNEKKEKWEVRVGSNIRALKSFFIDFDVDATDASKYDSQQSALLACKEFCKATAFPSPMLVSSGGGLHAYWPLEEELEAEIWRVHASKFKIGLLTHGIKFDTSRTADASSVLRVLGTHNYKKETPRPVALIKAAPSYSLRLMLEAIDKLPRDTSIPSPKQKLGPDIAGVAPNLEALGSNVEYAPQEPASFKAIMMNCPQVQALAKTGGNVSEPFWFAGLGLVKFCENPKKVAAFISDKHPDYSEAATQIKLDQWADKGPVTCHKFATENVGGCDACPHKGKITTPLQLGRQVKEAPPPVIEVENEEGERVEVTIPNPPFPYVRRASGGIVVRQKSDEGIETPIVVHEYDMYPVRRLFSEREGVESTIWRVKQPIVGWQDIHIDQSALAEARSLHGALLSKGVYVPPSRIKLMVNFMVAYITALQKETVIEKVASKMAWQDGNTSFVLDTKEYHANGSVTSHQLSPDLKQELPGLHSKGTLEGWKEAIQFYNNPGYEAHRMLLYAAFGSPLFTMTGHKGAILSATGKPGAGKSTTLQAIASVWGHPQRLIINGTKSGTTQNALMTLLSIYNNLPFPMDEITKLEPKLVAELCLSVSQGTGKIRSTRSGKLSSLVEAWGLLMITTANTDLYVTLAGDRRDASAEAMRALQIPVSLPNFHTKAQADHFINVSLQEHYGQAGHVFAQYVATNYAAVKKLVLDVTNMVDTKGAIQSGERFWSAIIASCTAGALVARQLGLIDGFPVEDDCKWAVRQLKSIRGSIREQMSSPREMLSEFLENHVDETLAISKLNNPNIQPTVDIAPRGALTIRHELDNDVLYVVRSAVRLYCNAVGANFTDIQDTLEHEGILVDRNAQKVLGSNTKFGKGQSRCWKIDMKELNK